MASRNNVARVVTQIRPQTIPDKRGKLLLKAQAREK